MHVPDPMDIPEPFSIHWTGLWTTRGESNSGNSDTFRYANSLNYGVAFSMQGGVTVSMVFFLWDIEDHRSGPGRRNLQ
jgi:hypothetical protein